MKHPRPIAWLAKFAVTALSFVLFCKAITPLIASAPQIEATENDGEAAQVYIEYRNDPTPRNVLVGTSLSYRLKEQFFMPLKLRNLAIPGRSILTGLTIIASYPTLPANVFIETNVMVWPIDDNFVRKFSYDTAPHFLIASPIRSLVAYFTPSPKEAVKLPGVDDTILSRPPIEYDNKVYVERGKKEWSGHNQDVSILSNIDAVERAVKTIEARGSNVYFFELPMAAGMANTDVSTTIRNAFHRRFPNPSRWLQPIYPVDQLRFADHAHLDERSALIVARAMEAEIMALPRTTISTR